MPNQTSETIAETFVDRFIYVLGTLKAILTDQRRNFSSDLLKKIAKIFKIRTTLFQSNRSLERSQHALDEYLKQYANEQEQWDRCIGLALFNYCIIPMSTRLLNILSKIARILINELLSPEDKLANYDDYLINLVTQLHVMQKNAREKMLLKPRSNLRNIIYLTLQ